MGRTPKNNTGGTSNDAPETEANQIKAAAKQPVSGAVAEAEEEAKGPDMAAGGDVDEKPKHKPAPMDEKAAAVFKDLEGEFLYSGAPLSFVCREGKEWNLTPLKTYDIAKLPKHELIANALVRKTLVKVPKPENDEA